MNEATRKRYQIKRKAIERYVSFKLGSTKDGRDTTNIFDHKIYIVKEIRLHAYIHQYHIALDYIKVRDHCHRTKQRKMSFYFWLSLDQRVIMILACGFYQQFPRNAQGIDRRGRASSFLYKWWISPKTIN